MFNPVLSDWFQYGSSLTIAALRTPGMARSAARSISVFAGPSGSRPMLVIQRYTSSLSARPLGNCSRSTRLTIRNTALQTMAQVSAISSTIRSAAVLWRLSVERMGRSCIMAGFRWFAPLRTP